MGPKIVLKLRGFRIRIANPNLNNNWSQHIIHLIKVKNPTCITGGGVGKVVSAGGFKVDLTQDGPILTRCPHSQPKIIYMSFYLQKNFWIDDC